MRGGNRLVANSGIMPAGITQAFSRERCATIEARWDVVSGRGQPIGADVTRRSMNPCITGLSIAQGTVLGLTGADDEVLYFLTCKKRLGQPSRPFASAGPRL
jgi:hypothetical protein